MAAKFCPKCQRVYPTSQRLCEVDRELLSLQDPYHLVGRTLLDKYRIEALVGLGGMGAVYCAHHLGIDRRVAFKILQPNIALSDEHVAELFEREAKVAGRLSHENIVDVTDAGRSEDGLAYIVMEWLEGRTLEEVLRTSGRFGFTRAAEILRQIAAALEEAHSKNVVHRDLKPANVMLVERGQRREQVKVLDFGIGKVIGETGSSVSAVMGTPSYASPEQLRLGGQIDARSDIYSLGVILYRMLSGRLPFKGASPTELIELQLTATPAPIGELRPGTPAAIESLISRMLAKVPADRPQTAREVADAFDSALAQAQTSELATRELAEEPHSGETTIERAQELAAQTTEDMYATNVAAPTPKAGRARPRLASVALVGAVAIVSGYGMYRYAFNSQQDASDAQIAAGDLAPSPVATPTPRVIATPRSEDSPPRAEGRSIRSKPKIEPTPARVVTPKESGNARSRIQTEASSVANRRMANMHYKQAYDLYIKGNYKAALSECDEALKLEPRHLRALNLKRKIQRAVKILGGR
jgi:serine/threonine-protein kinase